MRALWPICLTVALGCEPELPPNPVGTPDPNCIQAVQVDWSTRGVPEADAPGGFVEVCGAAVHPFATVEACAYPSDPSYASACPANGLRGLCAGCANSECVTADPTAEEPTCFCLRECTRDDECNDGRWCLCSQSIPQNFPTGPSQCVAGCRTDGECPSGERCLASTEQETRPHIWSGFHCTSRADTCDPRDIDACLDEFPVGVCVFADGAFQCRTPILD